MGLLQSHRSTRSPSLDNNLSIPLHVDRTGAGPEHDLDAALAEWRQSASELRSAAHALFARLDARAAL